MTKIDIIKALGGEKCLHVKSCSHPVLLVARRSNGLYYCEKCNTEVRAENSDDISIFTTQTCLHPLNQVRAIARYDDNDRYLCICGAMMSGAWIRSRRDAFS